MKLFGHDEHYANGRFPGLSDNLLGAGPNLVLFLLFSFCFYLF